jgi:hypothetical protein
MNLLGRAQTNSEEYPTSHASCFEVRLNVLRPIIQLHTHVIPLVQERGKIECHTSWFHASWLNASWFNESWFTGTFKIAC